ncbi:MAG: hypothetical protein KJ971_08595, partial [Firmicutes bacterium]|nr:hypothetical protein [Bacillota bacterium]
MDYTYEAYRIGAAAYWSGEPMPRSYTRWECQAWLDGYADAKRECPQLAEVCAGLPDAPLPTEMVQEV